MIPFWLFLTTAFATGSLTFRAMMWAVWGVPTHWVQSVSLVGSILLLVAAYVSARSLRIGRWLAAVALLAISSYYIPALPSLLPRAGVIIHWWVYLPPSLLVVAVAYTAFCFVQRVPRVLFPPHVSRVGTVIVVLFTVASASWAGWYWCGIGQERVETVPARWETTTTSKEAFGKQPLRFVALDSSVSVVVASDELYRHLQSNQKQTVNLQLTKTYDHGKFRAWGIYAIDGQRNNFLWLDGNLRE